MRLPKIAVLELTYQCNHRCFFCSCPWEYVSKYKDKELTTEEWKKVIDTLVEHGVSQVTITGGEPLLRQDLQELIRYIKYKKLKVNLITNGKALTDDFLVFIQEYNISLSVSVPGLETFSHHTGIDNVENVLNIFSKTSQMGIRTTANIAVTKKNLPELYKNIALPLLYGANYILLNRFLPGGRGMSHQKYLLTIDEVNQMLDIAEEVLSQAGRYGHVGTELPYCIINNPSKYKHLAISSKCAAGKEFFVVDPSGNIKVCNHSPQKLVHYTEIENLENHPYWLDYLQSNYIPDMCKDCKYLDRCDGGCREAAALYFGQKNDMDPCFDQMRNL